MEVSPVVIEGPGALSSSMVWDLQGAFYEQVGIAAFSSGEVPHLFTGSPLLARSYAAIVAAALEDFVATPDDRFDPTTPVYVVELGAGTGRLAFHLLRLLEKRHLPVPVVYVLSDLARENVAFFAEHPQLAPFIERGALDVARFDALVDEELLLECSGVRLTPGGCANPLIVIANYVFDVLPQDLFRCDAGSLSEELVSFAIESGDLSPGSAEFLDRLRVGVDARPCALPRYPDAGFDTLLAEVARSVRDGRILFPVGAMRVVRSLAALGGGRVTVIAGERPGRPVDEVQRDDDDVDRPRFVPPTDLLQMSIHGGTFSLPVDLGVFDAFALASGGAMLTGTSAVVGFGVHTLVLDGASGARSPRTVDAFRTAVGDAGPEDLFFALKAALDRDVTEIPLPMLLAILRLSGFDPYIFGRCYPGLDAATGGIELEAAVELERVLDAVFAADFPLDDRLDLAYGIALLLAPAGRFEAALAYLERSRERVGPSAAGAYNAALCALHLGLREEASRFLDEALELEPEFVPAVELRGSLELDEV